MATIILNKAQVTLNAVVLSTAVTQVSIDYKAELQDETAMGDTTRVRKAGLLDWTVSVDFNQDYATGAVDPTMFTLVGATAFAVILHADTAASGVTNPFYTGLGVLESYVPLGGSVGGLHKSRATILAAGPLTRCV